MTDEHTFVGNAETLTAAVFSRCEGDSPRQGWTRGEFNHEIHEIHELGKGDV
jgi:hypothetical protein